MNHVQLGPAHARDLPALVQLLNECGLATTDVPEMLHTFVTARVGDVLAGVAAMELGEQVGLLRSVAVAPAFRGRLVGEALCKLLLDQARKRGVLDVYLLTNDASDYFARFGFVTVDRDSAPAAIRVTRQFSELCPTTCTLMHGELGGVGDDERS